MTTTCRIERGAFRSARQRFGNHPVYALIIVAYLIGGITNVATAATKRPLTVQDALQTTRFMVADQHAKSIALSPDGQHYAAMLIRGNASRDGIEAEIIAGGLGSIEAAKPYTVARLFTRGLGASILGNGEGPDLLLPTTNFPVWIDNERVAFLWEDDKGVHQVVYANIKTKKWGFLTASNNDVTWFAAGPRNTLVYETKSKYSLTRSDQMWRTGFTVTNQDAYSLLIGAVDGATARGIAWGAREWFVQSGGSAPARKVSSTERGANYYSQPWLGQPAVSPNGSMAVVSGDPQTIPERWNRYKGRWLREYLQSVTNMSSSKAPSPSRPQQFFLVSIDKASARPLWNAPLQYGTAISWSPDSHSIVAWPVYLPLDSQDEDGLTGDAAAQIDVSTGKYLKLPIPGADAKKIDRVQWKDADAIEVDFDDQHIKPVVLEKRAGQWVRVDGKYPLPPETRVRVELRQDANTPPTLYAVDTRTGREAMVFDPNPDLRRDFSLGKVEFIHWKDDLGYTREGRLFLPADYQPNHRYPLVIQTASGDRYADFSLYGWGAPGATLGPGQTVYVAQPLAGQGIAVLQIGTPPAGYPLSEADARMHGYTSAIKYLYSIGLIDRHRVGIAGYSRNGWHVEHALAFSGFPFAAAIACDNIDSGYLEAAMMGWADTEQRNGSEPFGAGLKDWLEHAPTFNVEHIRTPLLLMVTDSFAGRGAPLAMQWEMFSRLRHLKKPVELYVIPNIERGSHNLQNPTQVLALQQRTMDWWLYWLKDQRDPSESKRQQYAAWDRLRTLRDEDAKHPAPPYLQWIAGPKQCKGGKSC
jgi:dipeptidyl aminopeptidase/acylaminoacyl peptidase